MDSHIKEKLSKLHDIIDSLGKVAVAFSGGVDSTFLLKIAHERLGDSVTAVTIDSPLNSPDEIAATKAFTASEKINHVILSIDLFKNNSVISNPPDRCYNCKLDVFRAIREFATSKGIVHIAEGSNHDDRDDYRPGMRAIHELKILSPLLDAGLTKDEIRSASRDRGLSVWNKPANPCLATRIPCGTAITKEMLETIYRAEQYLHSLGIRNVRVRHHGNLARIEVPADERKLFLDDSLSLQVAGQLKSLGFTHITLDIEGYRMGSMNEQVGKEKENGQG
jgi:pyridinium-3,5-biscarboxylic acid mononucleotide sulfurtransferase